MKPPIEREGMALLTVLLLVAVMAAVCVLLLDDVRFAVRRTTNVEQQAEMQSYAGIAEGLVRQRLSAMVASSADRTPLVPQWNGLPQDYELDGARARIVVRDGQACFNLNSLVLGQGEDLLPNPQGEQQFVELGVAIGLPRARMRALAQAITDWMDADQIVSGASGAEDETYFARSQPYRTSGLMLAEVSEIRAIKGVDRDSYERLRPYVCALPEARPTRLNINTLSREHAPLLVAIGAGQLELRQATAALAGRPQGGWPDVAAFWAQPMLNDVVADEAMKSQTTLTTRYFDIRIDIERDDTHVVRTATVQVSPEGVAQTIIRRWMPDE